MASIIPDPDNKCLALEDNPLEGRSYPLLQMFRLDSGDFVFTIAFGSALKYSRCADGYALCFKLCPLNLHRKFGSHKARQFWELRWMILSQFLQMVGFDSRCCHMVSKEH